MLINFIVLFVALSFFGIKITPALLFVPILLVPTLMLTVGIGLLFSTMTVKYRDISHLTEILFMILFYLTPIIYDLKMIPDPYHDYIQLNPITHIVQMFRTIILDGSIPTIGEFWTSFFYSLLFLLFGGAVFKFREKRLVEEL
jgi:ABC-2 type transport system permease protein